MVLSEGARRVGQKYLKPRTDVAMLKGIVQDDHIRVLPARQQSANAFPSVLANRHVGKGTVAAHLKRFVAAGGSRLSLFDGTKAAGRSAVASREHRRAESLFVKEVQDVFHVWCFPRTSHGKVSHADDRQWKTFGGKDTSVEQQVAHRRHGVIDPRQRDGQRSEKEGEVHAA